MYKLKWYNGNTLILKQKQKEEEQEQLGDNYPMWEENEDREEN